MKNEEISNENIETIVGTATEHYGRHEFEEAFEMYSRAAGMGDSNSLRMMGRMYSEGEGVDRDFRKAFDCFSQSAADGGVESRYELGRCYFKGIGVPADVPKGMDLITSAAQEGYAPAQNHLGSIYMNGNHVEKNIPYGKSWIKKAADQGYPKALHNMCQMYHHGPECDMDKYRECLMRASAASFPPALAEEGFNRMYGIHFDRDPEKGIEMLEAASKAGFVKAEAILGRAYYRGIGTEKNPEVAKKHLLVAAENDHVGSMYLLGDLFDLDTKSKDSAELAHFWFDRAAKKGNVGALYRLGRMYYFGRAVSKDYSVAFKHFLSAAEKGDDQSAYYVGMMYAHGLGTTLDLDLGMKWLRKETHCFYAEREYEIARICLNFDYRFRDVNDFLSHIKIAAKLGCVDAMYDLAHYYQNNKKEPSTSDAVYWHMSASEGGHPASMMEVAGHYLSGAFIPQSTEKAIKLYEKVYSMNHDPEAAANIGMIYEEGLYCEKDLKKAKKWYLAAAREHSGFAMFRISRLCKGKSENDESIFWLRRSADAGFGDAAALLAEYYEDGTYVPRSILRAVHWYHDAAFCDNKCAQDRFEKLLIRIDENEKESEMEYLKRIAGEEEDTSIMIEIAEKSAGQKEKKLWYSMAADLGDGDALRWMEENGRKKNHKKKDAEGAKE